MSCKAHCCVIRKVLLLPKCPSRTKLGQREEGPYPPEQFLDHRLDASQLCGQFYLSFLPVPTAFGMSWFSRERAGLAFPGFFLLIRFSCGFLSIALDHLFDTHRVRASLPGVDQ